MPVFLVPDSASPESFAVPGVSPPLILSRLKLETRSEHEAVERAFDLMSPSLTPEGYRQHLERFYGFYAPLEDALQAACAEKATQPSEFSVSPATRTALVARLNKTAHLRQDLHYLGVMTETVPLCRDLPQLGSEAEVLGCAYVMEGATLGGRMITQHIRAALGVTPATGGSFFEGYGDDTGNMWKGMRQLLVIGSPDKPAENTIVANAIATFASLRGWCESVQK